MELFYSLKEDYILNGESSIVSNLFNKEYYDNYMFSENDTGYFYFDYDIDFENELPYAEINTQISVKENYESFIKSLMNLPETNKAGQKLNVKGTASADHTKPYDYLMFEKDLYRDFIDSGYVCGNKIKLNTNFGVTLEAEGMSRRLKDFIGYRRCDEAGHSDIIDSNWKVGDNIIKYKRKLK